MRKRVDTGISASSLRSKTLRILRVVVGIAVAAAGVLIVLGELDHDLYRCNSDVPVMEVRFWPPFAAESIIAAGLILAGWPRPRGRAEQLTSQRRWIGQTALSVIALLLSSVLILLTQGRAVGPCVWGEPTQLTVWATGHVAGPVILTIGVLAAVWPTSRGDRRHQLKDEISRVR